YFENERVACLSNIVISPSFLQTVQWSQWQDRELRTIWNRLKNGEHHVPCPFLFSLSLFSHDLSLTLGSSLPDAPLSCCRHLSPSPSRGNHRQSSLAPHPSRSRPLGAAWELAIAGEEKDAVSDFWPPAKIPSTIRPPIGPVGFVLSQRSSRYIYLNSILPGLKVAIFGYFEFNSSEKLVYRKRTIEDLELVSDPPRDRQRYLEDSIAWYCYSSEVVSSAISVIKRKCVLTQNKANQRQPHRGYRQQQQLLP
ncbi:hypothetical protein PanWU01x14_239310, partial [Parasponia andersonii]